MKKRATYGVILGLWSYLFIATSFAGDKGLYADATTPILQQPSPYTTIHPIPEVMTEIQGEIVTDTVGEVVGSIRHLLVDINAGRIASVIISVDSKTELNVQWCVFPWGTVRLDPDRNSFVLAGQKDMLQVSLRCSPDAWPGLPTSSGPPPSLYEGTELIGMKVHTSAGKELGNIEDLVVDPESGVITYAVLSFEDAKEDSRTIFFGLPWQTVWLDPHKHAFVTQVEKTTLEDTLGEARNRQAIEKG